MTLLNFGTSNPIHSHPILILMNKVFFNLMIVLTCFSCQQKTQAPETGHISQIQAPAVRLADGVPLQISLHLRWDIENPEHFYATYDSISGFVRHILQPKIMEALGDMAFGYASIDSVFGPQRPRFLADLRQCIQPLCRADGITIREVVVPGIGFPGSYVEAMERAGLQRQELEAIRRAIILETAQAEKERKMTEVRARIQVAQEEANAKIQEIQTRGEERRRTAELARAETQAQLDYKKAMTEAERQRALNQTELEKLTGLKELEVQKIQQMNASDVQKQTELAKIYSGNPDYASFIIDKELATNVGVAILPPSGNIPNLLDRFWKTKKK
jgi:regulator of protease activity HflC (stomatin/prohibitin superfamily)